MPANRRVKACSKDIPAEARRSFQHHVWETKGGMAGRPGEKCLLLPVDPVADS